jgi:tRNA pseudouridine13 synthase
LVNGADVAAARAVLEELEATGAPNYYGPQRFGARGDNAVQGLAVLRGRLRANRWKRDLLVSSLQSFVFNEVAARRVEEGTVDAALLGDVLRREDSGGLFVCTDPEADKPRIRGFEVSPTGPLPGKKMVRPSGEVAAAESSVLAELGLDEVLFAREVGTRRPLRVPVRDWSIEPRGDGVELTFCCPAGAFATSVIREIAVTPP